MPNKRLGEILLEAGLISDKQLRCALTVQKKRHARLGQVLADLGFISEQLMAKVLEFQLGISAVSLSESTVNPAFVNIIPRHLAQKYLVFPLYVKENVMHIAMADPLDHAAIKEIRMACGLKVEVCLTTKSEVEKAIGRYCKKQEKRVADPDVADGD